MIQENRRRPNSRPAFLDISLEERKKRNAAVVALLDSFMEGDEREQKETWQFLKKALDEDRPSHRKLFPE